MSQMQPPPGYPQPPFGQPPYGQPPYGQPPYGQPYPYPPFLPPRRTSAAAVTSLICGIVMCLPLLSSLLAVIFGLVGIGRTSGGQMRGRGMAVAGLLLGIIGLIGWPAAGYWFYQESKPVIAVTRDFLLSAADGKVDDALADCTGDISRKEMEQFIETMKQKGAYDRFSVTGLNIETTNSGAFRWTIDGSARFDKGDRDVKIQLLKQGSRYKVSYAKFE